MYLKNNNTGQHKRLLVLRIEVVRERRAHQHHGDVPRGGEEPQRLGDHCSEPATLLDLTVFSVAAADFYILYFL